MASSPSRSPRSKKTFDQPAILGNVALRVEDYRLQDNVLTVRGVDVATGKSLTAQMMTPARAANMMPKAGGGDERAAVEEWANRLSGQHGLEEFANPNSANHVKIGGVLQLSNVRLDFSDKKYYAQNSYALINDPAKSEVLSGTLSFSKFDNGSIRVQLFQPENIVALIKGEVEPTRIAIAAALDPKSPVGNGMMTRNAMVTVSEARENGFVEFNTYFLKSASTEVAGDGGSTYSLSKGFGDALERSTLDQKTGPAFAVLAGVAGVPFEKIAARVADSGEKATVVSGLQRYYDSAQRDGVNVSITPGYTIPLLKTASARIAQREELFAAAVFKGTIAIATTVKTGEAMERPAAYAVMPGKSLSRTPPEVAPDIAKSAQAAQRKTFGIEFGSKAAEPESKTTATAAPEEARLSQGPTNF